MSLVSELVPTIEIQRREGGWESASTIAPTAREQLRYANALSRWIGDANGNIAAIRLRFDLMIRA